MIQTDLTGELIPATVSETPILPDWDLWSLCSDGCYMMIPIVILFLILIAVFFFRLVVINTGCRLDNLFMEKIKDMLHDNEIESAENLCRKTSTPSSRIIWQGLSMLGMPIADISNSLKFTLDVEIGNLKKSLGWIRFIAFVAPLLGLTGALIGMVHLFAENPEMPVGMLISIPAITFICGLIVGILAVSGYEYLKAKLNTAEITLNSVSVVFIGLLNEPGD